MSRRSVFGVLALIVWPLSWADATAAVHNYPALPGDVASERFRLSVDGTAVPCIRYQKGGNHNFAVARFASDSASPAYAITVDEEIRDYKIHPRRYYPADAVSVEGNTLTFKLNAALRYVIVEINDHRPLLAIVNDPPEDPAEVPDPSAPNVLNATRFVKDITGKTDVTAQVAAAVDELYANDQYDTLFFPDGVYLYGGLEIRDRVGKPVTIYVSEGALLKNRVQPAVDAMEPAIGIWDSEGVTIAGRGMFDASGYANYDKAHGGWTHDAVSSHHQGGVMVVRSQDVTFRDTYLRDSKQWNYETHTARDVVFRNIKALTPYAQPWIDGINLASGQDILVDGAMTLGNDDCFATGHYNPDSLNLAAPDRLTWDYRDSDNITLRNTLHWTCEAGNGIRLGHGVMGCRLRNYLFDNFNAVNFKGGDRGVTVQRGGGAGHDYPHYNSLIFKNCSFDTSRVSKNMQVLALRDAKINSVQVLDCWFSNPNASCAFENIRNLTVHGLHVDGRRVDQLPGESFRLINVDQPILDFSVNACDAFRFTGDSQPRYRVAAGELIEFTIGATSADGQTAVPVKTLPDSRLPPNARFDGRTGEFRWRPSAGQYGTFGLVFIATDGQNTLVQRIVMEVVSDRHSETQ